MPRELIAKAIWVLPAILVIGAIVIFCLILQALAAAYVTPIDHPGSSPAPAFLQFDTLLGQVEKAFSIAPTSSFDTCCAQGAPTWHEPVTLVLVAAFYNLFGFLWLLHSVSLERVEIRSKILFTFWLSDARVLVFATELRPLSWGGHWGIARDTDYWRGWPELSLPRLFVLALISCLWFFVLNPLISRCRAVRFLCHCLLQEELLCGWFWSRLYFP